MSDAPSPYYAGPQRRTPLAWKVAVVPILIAVIALGVWIAGALISDDMNVAMALTGVWFATAGLACLLVVRARRDMLLPVFGTYAVCVVAIGGFLAYESLVDDEVNETVVVGTPASQAPAEEAPARGDEARERAPAAPRNVQVADGAFASGAHTTEGKAAVVDLAEGGRVLTLTDFETDPGPDLRVYLATDESASDFEDLGGLKGNVGNQQYEVPKGVDLDKYSTVVIWCRAFSVEFGSAPLERS